ncbi:MAG: HAD family hydrolase [Gammaproteobacteria bacterium]|nr:MAG: HAD family hydrolase [Gammaproteobacteria bacterium]|tara:strand:- start:20714 stop:21361 length:648 start_codon:yes stop_codon:yes gene_type:complete
MKLNQYSSIFWDFGGVITSSPFEAFKKFEIENDLPENFLRKVNSTNPQNNAWALLEQSKINQIEFNDLFFQESSELGFGVNGLKVLDLLEGDLRLGMVDIIKTLKKMDFIQACLTNNFIPDNDNQPDMMDLIKKTEVFNLFDFIFESKEIGLRKPDQAFYDYVLEKVDIPPEKIIFLDDLGINLKPAKAMGMTTIKVISESQAKEDLERILKIKF